MKKTVLFDLDGTLLPMDQDLFVKAYFGRFAQKLAPYGYESETLIKAIWAGIDAMVQNDGSRTNEEVFWENFCAVMGRDCRKDEPLFTEYYENEFQQVEAVCGRNAAAAETIALCKDLGAEVVLATNPLFPTIATESRIRWAGLQREDFRFVTTYENSRYCKPNPAYYSEILEKLGLRAEDCLMVGNDAVEDLAAAQLGIPVFLLTDCLINKNGVALEELPHGGFNELQEWLREELQ